MASPSTPVRLTGTVTESPVTGGFLCPLESGAAANLNCNGTTIYAASSYGSAYLNSLLPGDQEAFVNSPTDAAADNYLILCAQAATIGTGPTNHYIAHWLSTGSGTVDIFRDIGGSRTTLHTYDVSALVTSLVIDNTHQVWAQKIGSTISLYFDGLLQGTVSDSTYTGGYIGFETNARSANGGATLLGGGGLAAAGGLIPQFARIRYSG